MNILQITPGSGDSFYCENCMRDEDLVRAVRAAGHDALMVPLYLPPLGRRPDSAGVAPIFYGGINVYLQQKLRLFRRTPRWVDRLFDATGLLTLAGRLAGFTRAEELGETTISMLRGEDGRQKKELDRLVAWLVENHKPDVVVLSNVLLVGLARRVREALGCAVVCLLQDEDEFLDDLPEAQRRRAWEIIAARAGGVDRFIAVSEYYKGVMAERLGVAADRIDVVTVGVNPDDYAVADTPPDAPTIGFLSRTCRPKGLDLLVEALAKLKADERLRSCRLRVAGGSTGADGDYLRRVRRRAARLGVDADVEFLANVDRGPRREFLRSLTVLSVPARRGEASGRYVLDALAAGVPVVEPSVGALPELLEATGGGLLCEPDDATSLAEKLSEILLDPVRARQLGDAGRRKVLERFTVERMASGFLRSCAAAAKREPDHG